MKHKDARCWWRVLFNPKARIPKRTRRFHLLLLVLLILFASKWIETYHRMIVSGDSVTVEVNSITVEKRYPSGRHREIIVLSNEDTHYYYRYYGDNSADYVKRVQHAITEAGGEIDIVVSGYHSFGDRLANLEEIIRFSVGKSVFLSIEGTRKDNQEAQRFYSGISIAIGLFLAAHYIGTLAWHNVITIQKQRIREKTEK